MNLPEYVKAIEVAAKTFRAACNEASLKYEDAIAQAQRQFFDSGNVIEEGHDPWMDKIEKAAR